MVGVGFPYMVGPVGVFVLFLNQNRMPGTVLVDFWRRTELESMTKCCCESKTVRTKLTCKDDRCQKLCKPGMHQQKSRTSSTLHTRYRHKQNLSFKFLPMSSKKIAWSNFRLELHTISFSSRWFDRSWLCHVDQQQDIRHVHVSCQEKVDHYREWHPVYPKSCCPAIWPLQW
jgi:hypothetical protein